MSVNLNPEKALIFRIVHVANVPWILDHGMHCPNSAEQDPDFIDIGNVSLIEKREKRIIPVSPGGNLSDYVPFYFTPFSIMLLNILTGHGDVRRREKNEIVIFVSSIHHLKKLNVPFLFTSQHAYAVGTEYFSETNNLSRIDWALLQSRNFKTDDADPGKQLRYQAEALVYRHMPLEALMGIGCYNDDVKTSLESLVSLRSLKIAVKMTPNWYFQSS